ncbi:MAG: M23 family metallopeptidase [Flavobacterium sp.]|nr:MAG: M23 family metallopeptidase [Flavobacterium sp.]
MRLLTCLLLISTSLFSQTYPKNYFRSPLDIPLQLAGNFGELRSNHFHAGFDFRTQQKEGFNVYAAADGYVSRIKISTYGYGKAIYITHPNGYTTVYGHLQNAAGKIQDYIKAYQYKVQAYEFDYFPEPGDLPVKKGDLVAFSGNTGGSEGPHLHFEIRDSKTENIINPYLFGFTSELPDTKKPVITNLMVYPIDENSVVNKSSAPISLDVKKLSDGSYVAEKVYAKGRIGFGFSGSDANNNSSNPNGIYRIDSYLNGNPSFGYTFDTFHFEETRYVNALIDYQRYKATSQRVQKLFMKNKYNLKLMRPGADLGMIDIKPNLDNVYKIETADFNGNVSTISVPIEFSDSAPITPREIKRTPYYLEVDKDHNYEQGKYSVFFPAGTFYDDFYLDFDVHDDTLLLNNKNMPVHSGYTISYKDTSVPASERERTFIGTWTGKRVTYNESWYKDGAFQTKVKMLGQFALAKDTLKPKITLAKPIEGKWLSKQNSLSVFIRDDLSGIKKYDGWLNGKWILLEYDYRTGRLVYNFNDGIAADGRNELKVVVTDNVGNSAIFETYFFRSQQ